ncbi:MAG: DUF4105 domain-containing protein [Candidatus Moranbacteria bacterium]|nr:DUF4105 domain-containing protein [Candidatus Moranbacteria bacterium]
MAICVERLCYEQEEITRLKPTVIWHPKTKKTKELTGIAIAILIFATWEWLKPVPTIGDWQSHVAIMPTADIDDDSVTVHKVRNFRYSEAETASVIGYYDRTYDLSKLTRIWFVAEPFSQSGNAAHTFLSFEFDDGNHLAISIEARKKNGQEYGVFRGLLRAYPLMYVATDEHDAVMVRTNVRKHEVYMYPVRTTPDKARAVLVDMLRTMNDLTVHPRWYNTLSANRTSLLVGHVNHVTPHRLPDWSWQLLFTGHADELALASGLLDTDLPIDTARKKYGITAISQNIGDVENYSDLIRQELRK